MVKRLARVARRRCLLKPLVDPLPGQQLRLRVPSTSLRGLVPAAAPSPRLLPAAPPSPRLLPAASRGPLDPGWRSKFDPARFGPAEAWDPAGETAAAK